MKTYLKIKYYQLLLLSLRRSFKKDLTYKQYSFPYYKGRKKVNTQKFGLSTIYKNEDKAYKILTLLNKI